MPELYSDLINTKVFQLEIPEYYQPMLPEYFRQHLNSGYAMINGVPVSDQEYQEHTGEAVERDDFIPLPPYVGDPLNMCLSFCSTATIIHMNDNLVPFRFVNPEDIPKVVAILKGYIQEIGPYVMQDPKLKPYKDYVDLAKETMGKLESVYNEMVNDFNVRHQIPNKKELTLLDLLNSMK